LIVVLGGVLCAGRATAAIDPKLESVLLGAWALNFMNNPPPPYRIVYFTSPTTATLYDIKTQKVLGTFQLKWYSTVGARGEFTWPNGKKGPASVGFLARRGSRYAMGKQFTLTVQISLYRPKGHGWMAASYGWRIAKPDWIK
jgi:hypothetical protein